MAEMMERDVKESSKLKKMMDKFFTGRKGKYFLPFTAIILTLGLFVVLAIEIGSLTTEMRHEYSGVHPVEMSSSLFIEEGFILGLFYELQRENLGDGFSFENDLVFVRDEEEFELEDDRFLRSWEQELRSQISRIQHNLATTHRNLQFVALDNETGVTISRSFGGELEQLATGTITEELIRFLAAEFQQIGVVHYSSSGRMEFPLILNQENFDAVADFIQRRDDTMFWLDNTPIFPLGEARIYVERFQNWENFEWRSPENMTFIFAVPQEWTQMESYGLTWTDQLWNHSWRIGNVLGEYFNLSLLIMIGAAYFMSWKLIDEDRIFKKYATYSIEVIGLAQFLLILWFHNLSRGFVLSIGNVNRRGWHELTRNLTSISLTLVISVLALTMMGYLVVYIRQLHRSGFRQNFKKHSFFFRRQKVLDLSASFDRKMLFIILAHVISFSFLFIATADGRDFVLIAILITIVYAAILFILIKKKLTSTQNHYRRLLDLTRSLSSGNLEAQINEDLGIFNSLKNDMINLKEGLKVAVEKAIVSEKMKTDLISNVSHDLKTPLTSIINYIDLLHDEQLTPQKKLQYLGVLEQKSNRLKDLIEDLFEMSKVTSGTIKLDILPLNIVSLMKQSISELEDELREANITVRTTFPPEPVILLLDGQRTHRVFENLLVNIIKYALPGTRAYLDIDDSPSATQITLKNISASEIDVDANTLMERFVRADTARSTEGSGLGLAIAQSLVEIQGGEFNLSVDGDLFKATIIFAKN